jgi:hypothetical protein
MSKTSLPAAYQQKVLSGAAASELHSYNEALPLMLVRYCGPGLLGLGITALIAGFMSGMAGNLRHLPLCPCLAHAQFWPNSRLHLLPKV